MAEEPKHFRMTVRDQGSYDMTMRSKRHFLFLAVVGSTSVLVGAGVRIHAAPHPKPQALESKQVPPKTLLKSLAGKWSGTVRTWFKPDKLEDESMVTGEFSPLLGGRFMRHTYEGSMKGKPRHGEETIAYNGVDKRFEVSWVDDFHMSYGILYSTGEAMQHGFSVKGSYGIGNGAPPWGWRTEYQLIDADHLTITAYNIKPGEPETKAVETVYTRVKPIQ